MEILFVICVVIVCVFVWRLGKAQKNRFLRAKSDYEIALLKLRKKPNDPELRTKALEIGRNYAFLCRDMECVTIFDEVALMNDLQAASAGSSKSLKDQSLSIEERLHRLEQLMLNGYLTKEQYELKKSKILDDL